MIETAPQLKQIFAEQARDYTDRLENKISELDANLPNFHEQLDWLISTNNSLREAAIKAEFYTDNSPFTKIIQRFEETINSLRDYQCDIDWIIKGLLFEVINAINQMIHEYCAAPVVTSGWLELQNSLFDQLNEHLQMNSDEFNQFKTNNGKLNEPFNLDNTSEVLDLFNLSSNLDANLNSNLDFNLDFNFDSDIEPSIDFEVNSSDRLYLNIASQMDNPNTFVMIQLDENLDENLTKDSNEDLAESLSEDVTEKNLSEGKGNLPELLHQSSENSELSKPQFLVEIFSESDANEYQLYEISDFSVSDVDTAIEESPIYQSNYNHHENETNSDFTNGDLTIEEESVFFNPIDNRASVCIPVSNLEGLVSQSEGLLVRKGRLDLYLNEIGTLVGEAQRNIQLLELNSANQNQAPIASLQNTFERLVTIRDRVEQQAKTINRDLHNLRKNIQKSLNQPLSSIVRSFPRIVRELSLQYGNQAELVVQGAEVTIEGIFAAIIAEALELLLRNAFECGIESTNDRQEQGKPLRGKIEIIAKKTNDNTIIQFSDDGRGFNIERNFSSSAMAGLKFNDVKHKLEEIEGKIFVKSQIGQGRQFTIVLPNKLSLLRVLMVDINRIYLAIPSNVILEVIPIADCHNLFDEERQTLLWRDRKIPVLSLSSALKVNCRRNFDQVNQSIPEDKQSPRDRLLEHKPANVAPAFLAIGLENGQANTLIALQTNGCWNEQEASFHQIEGDIPLPSIFLGAVILGNNLAVPLLDPSALINQTLHSSSNSNSNFSSFDSHSSRSLAQVVRGRSPKPKNLEDPELIAELLSSDPVEERSQALPKALPKVLLVEPFANVRYYLAMTLTKSGFLTEEVIDGKEAIAFLKERLKNGLDIDIVIVDLDMPQMDGFKFLKDIRADVSLQKLPVVVLAARNNESDRRLALELGATAFFSKPYREQELLKILQQIIS